MDITKLKEYAVKPPLFEKGKSPEAFWDHPHISKMMLQAHLNPEWDAASRKKETIEKSCRWIQEIVQMTEGTNVIDLGCGPGLYSERLSATGAKITGVDYSKRSIEYATNKAKENNLPIVYRYQNYLEMSYEDEFNVAMMIYCDFGVLSEQKSKELLGRVHKLLKKDGYFIFDVWSTSFAELTTEYKKWNISDKGGFWSPKPYLELIDKTYDEKERASLRQHIIAEENQTIVYNLWERCYTPETISDLLEEAGFKVVGIYGDLTGEPYTESSNTIGIIAKKVDKENTTKNEAPISYCGINCCQCPVYIATAQHDEKLKQKIATEWGAMYEREFRVKDIHCKGCKSGERFIMCKLCDIIECNVVKGNSHCKVCSNYPCERIARFETNLRSTGKYYE